MAERVAGVGAWDAEHETACVPDVVHDDLCAARVAVPLEGDRAAGVLACVEFQEHEWLLPASWETLAAVVTAARMRLRLPDRPRVAPWVSDGD
jgi:hypothetical protein